MGTGESLIQMEPSRSTQMFRMFLTFSSIFSVAAASAHSMGRSLSVLEDRGDHEEDEKEEGDISQGGRRDLRRRLRFPI